MHTVRPVWPIKYEQSDKYTELTDSKYSNNLKMCRQCIYGYISKQKLYKLCDAWLIAVRQPGRKM